VKYRPYPTYKPSSIEWLGMVPQHWTTPPLYSRYRIELGKMLDESRITGTHLVPYLRNVDVQWDAINTSNLPEMDIRQDEFSRYTLKVGDLLVCEGGEVGRAAIFRMSTSAIGFQKALHRLRGLDSSESSRFMYYVLYWASHFGVFVAEGNPNTIPHLTGEKLRRYRFPRPPLPEQQIIADSLDREIAKLDRLAGKNQELIEKLKEKRTALIARTVTRGLPPEAARSAGLNPHPLLKPSGIEWLGEVPEHWAVRPGRRLGRLFGSVSPSEEDFVDEGGAPFAKVDDLNSLGPDLCLGFAKSRVVGFSSPLKRRFLLFPKRGAAIFTNKVAIAEPGILFDSNLMGWNVDSTNDVKYVAYCLIARRLDDLADVSTVPQINNKHIYPAPFPVPGLPEQRAIADFLDRETRKIDRMVEKVEAAVERLQEYRSALITAAVTGKLDVREDQHHEH
jgi:type I restriction enzyme, S subunit